MAEGMDVAGDNSEMGEAGTTPRQMELHGAPEAGVLAGFLVFSAELEDEKTSHTWLYLAIQDCVVVDQDLQAMAFRSSLELVLTLQARDMSQENRQD